jgi:superfamily I DNA/RNA helicase
MQYTDEQLAIVDAAREPADLCVLARAGTGKTSTNVAIAEDQPDRRFLYLAFNKRVADEGKRRFGPNVTVKTAHSLAFGAVGRHFGARIKTSPYQIKHDLTDRFATAWESAGGPRDQEQLALYAALQAIDAFTASAASELDDEEHVAEGPYDRELVGAIARGMWNAMSDPGDWSPVTHDVYLKIWQLALAGEHDAFGANTRSISADMILFDEFQDASPAMLDICIRSGVPTIGTGDPRQAIYGWRGAVDAFGRVDFPVLPLSVSWRFGSEIATPANDVLEVLGETILIRGRGPSGRVVVNDTARPNAIVARTNAGLIGEAIRVVDEGASIHVVGGHEQIFAWLMAAWELFRWNRTRHPAFAMFASWAALKTASEQPIGRTYKPFVALVEQYRNDVPGILRRLEGSCAPDDLADVTLSSVHRYKGQEADVVRMADDFGLFCYPNTKPGAFEPYIIDQEEANLAYVALTRARKVLDLGGYAGTLRQSLANARALRNPTPPRPRSIR